MTTGQRPFSGESTGELLEAIFTREPLSPTAIKLREVAYPALFAATA